MTEQSDKPSVDGLMELVADALRLILPMAKGYAAAHPVGANAEKVEHAQAVLAALAGPLEEPQEPTSDQENLAQASGGGDLQTALPRWEPIDTAPKDATAVLVMRNLWPGCKGGVAEECNGHNTYVAEWWQGERGGHGAWVCYMDAVHDPRCPVEPTHWMPLPLPPGEPAGAVPSDKPAASSESSVSVPKEQQAVEILRELMQCAHSDPYAKKPWAPGQLGRFLTVNMPGALWDRARALTAGERL